jgi:D-lactate dehydrogenase
MNNMASAVVFLDVEETDCTAVRQRFPLVKFYEGRLSEKELIDACKDAEIISTFIYTRFTKAVIDKLPALKLLCTRSVGFDHIDINACREKGVLVCNVPDYGSHVIAEHVFALLLSTLRHIPEGDARVEAGTFDYHGLRGIALRGKTIGILGTGKIGRRVAKIAHGFGMKIIANDRCRTTYIEEAFDVRYVPFEELLQQSDIFTLHIPATKETEHLLNAATFSQMKNGVVLVNTARGSLIDSSALLTALQSGKVSHALLDVLEHEQNFEENKELISHPHVVSTPHIAFYADDSMKNMYLDCFQSIDEFLAGKIPEHIIHTPNIVCDVPAIALKQI